MMGVSVTDSELWGRTPELSKPAILAGLLVLGAGGGRSGESNDNRLKGARYRHQPSRLTAAGHDLHQE